MVIVLQERQKHCLGYLRSVRACYKSEQTHKVKENVSFVVLFLRVRLLEE